MNADGLSGRMKLPVDWATSEYATHISLLTELFVRFAPKRILETGSGDYSTAYFLSQDIDELVSIENDPGWTKDTKDKRHTVLSVDGPVANHLPDLSKFDLVFVDDDPVDCRPATIAAVIASAPNLVVIHDTDYMPYHRFIGNVPNHTDTLRKPHTTVICPAGNKEFSEWLVTR